MKFLSWKDLAARRTTSVSTEKRRVKSDPRHPKPIPVSAGRVAFLEPEIESYDDGILIPEGRLAQRDAGRHDHEDEPEAVEAL